MRSFNRKIFLYSLLISTFTISVLSCKDEWVEAGNQPPDQGYFPLQSGNWIEYEVDSIVHYDSDDLFNVDTAIGNFHFYIREETDAPFTDGENQTAYVIRRYKRESDSLPWNSECLWTAKVNTLSAQRVEDNVRFIRLKFPINSEATWEGNAFNFFPAETYSYEEVFEPMQVGNLYFDSTITVLQNDFTSLINRVYKKEIYGAHAGLLFKELDSVNTKNTVNGTIILNGLEYKSNITGYGNN